MGLELLGPCGWWSEGVRAAIWTTAEARRSVVAVVGPEVADDGSFERARARAQPWVDAREAGVLPLLGVELVSGSTVRAGAPGPSRAAWVYDDPGGVAAVHLLGGEAVPHRVAAELVAEVADRIEPLAAAGRYHPGLTLDDLVFGADGAVRVAGWVSPFGRAPIHRPPRAVEDSTGMVWRLGVLLAELLTGAPPTPSSDRAGHELVLRRLLIRVMSRPGPVFPERYRDWLVGMLAWDGDQRPPLSRVAPSLRDIAAASPGPDLAQRVREVVELRRRLELPPGLPLVEPSLEIVPTVPPVTMASERTEEMELGDTEFGETPLLDDVTAVSLDGEAPLRALGAMVSGEHGTIPVYVGPPPEAVRKPSRLPEALFVPDDLPDPDELRELRNGRIAWAAAAVLTVTAALLLGYLFN